MISIICLVLAYIIDNCFSILPKIVQEYEYHLIQKFVELGIIFISIFLGLLLFQERFPESIILSKPLHSRLQLIIIVYIAISLYAAMKNGKRLNKSIYIDEIEEIREHPVFFLEHLLIDYQYILAKQEQSLSMLKALSPIPFVILLTDSISFLIGSMNDSLDQPYSEYLNIGAIISVCLYIYITYRQYSSYQETLFMIKTIKRKIYFLEHPSLRIKKKSY
ncbi:hypothetical protein NGG61_16355 [Enterococcus casseliflavus]|uniref:hypothetical protein n=1 Tax=Enterococcus casseliflavus TaxID=37734 RepID=UPI002DB8DF21|nr:hypothetical protein [Enterococcus casseliflavus]MEB8401503.1 hypothetical protein [Enterococcus casseliflavus]